MTVADMMMNASNQSAGLQNAEQVCPTFPDDKFENEIKEVCATEAQAILSSTQNLEKDLDKLENGTEVEILDDSSTKVKVIYNGKA